MLNAQGDQAGAITLYQRVLRIQAKLFGSRDHYNTARTEMNLAHCLLKAGDTEQARELLMHAERVLSTQLPSGHS